MLNPPAENTISEAPSQEGENYIEPDDFGAFPPLGLLYVTTYLEQNTSGHEILFLDCVGEKKNHDELGKIAADFRPDIVGITSFTISLIDVCIAARDIRKLNPTAHICLGGHHPIAFPFESAQLLEFDSIIVGEGEIAFTELVKSIEQEKEITLFPGVYTRTLIQKYINMPVNDKRFISRVSVPPAYIENIDVLPIPDRSHISHIRYHSSAGISDNLATIISSRGCPYRCTYCDVPYKKYRKRSIEKVVDEVEDCLQRGYYEFHFYDDLFNITPEHIISFCDELQRRGLKLYWSFRGRANSVTKESLIRAKQAGCRLISFGVETGSDYGLKLIKKGVTTAKFREVFKYCRQLKILTIADFIIGFPFEKNADDIRKNIDYLISLDPDYTLIGVLMLLPNTEIYGEAVKKGIVDQDKWIQFSLNPTKEFAIEYWTEYMSVAELIELRKKAYKRFYMRPKYFLRSILSIRTWYEFKTKAKGFLTLLR